jgi:hypothetical protein
MLKKILGGVIVLVIAVAIFGGGGDDADTTASDDTTTVTTTDESGDTETEAVEEVADEEPAKEAPVKAVNIRAAKLVKEFEKNELQADAKYKGKTLRITGVVAEVDTELLDDEKYYVSLGSGSKWEFLYVNCHDMSNDELATLKVGKHATVIGKFDDGGDLGVEVADCQLA